MPQLSTAIDALRGTVKIVIEADNGEKQQLDFRWCKFDEHGTKTGFVLSFSEHPIFVTERAAEHFIRTIVANLASTLGVAPGTLVITNHLGDNLQDIQFLPPTFEGNEMDISDFVAAQDSIKKMFSAYEQMGDLSSDFIEACSDEGILDDILSLVQIRASGFVLTVRNPNTEE